MSYTHRQVVKDAENAITAVHSDTSVLPQQTAESLRNLEGMCAMLAQACEDEDDDAPGAETESAA